MPELPEVECLTRAIRKVASGKTIAKVRFYRNDLRDPIPVRRINKLLVGSEITSVTRRSKYMLLETDSGVGVIHLGMTGNFICQDSPKVVANHTHAVFTIKDGTSEKYLHYIDPRRFGRISVMTREEISEHPWFTSLGPEPLEMKNLGEHLFAASRSRKVPVKNFIMDSKIVVGVGNIYASESLFRSGIRPEKPCGKVSAAKYQVLGIEIQKVLKNAIKAGGTTFRDFRNSDGNPGYFRIQLAVYNRTGEPCVTCSKPVKQVKLGGRSSFYCAGCQK